MKWISVKSASAVRLEGIEVEVDLVNDSARSITFTDGVGNRVRAVYTGYSIELQTPAPPKMVTKFLLEGEVAGLKVHEVFGERYEAESRKQQLQSLISGTVEFNEFSISEIQLAEEE